MGCFLEPATSWPNNLAIFGVKTEQDTKESLKWAETRGNQGKVRFYSAFYCTAPQSTFTPELQQMLFLEPKFECSLDFYCLCVGAGMSGIRSESKKHPQDADFFIKI